MLSHTRWFLSIPLTVLFLLAPESSVAADGGVSFLSDQELTKTFPDDQPDVTFSVKVINGSDASQDIYLDLVGLTDQSGMLVPPGVLPSDLPRKAESVTSGQVITFELTLSRVEGLSKSYMGQLVAYGDDGTVARLGLTLVVAKPAVEVPTVASLEPDFPEAEVTLVKSNFLPSPLSYLGLNIIMPIAVQVSKASPKPQMVGSVSGSNGQMGLVVWEGTTLRVEGITQAGEYTGKADLLPDDEEAGKVTLKVQVKDMFLWPLVVLVAGLFISARLNRYVKFSRPLRQLQVDLTNLKERAGSLQNEAEKALPADWPVTKNVYRIYHKQNGTESGLLFMAADNTKKSFIEAQSDEERKKWGPNGDEFKRIQGYVDALPELYKLSRAAAMHYSELKRFAEDYDQDLSFDELDVAKMVEGALRPALIESASELEKLQKDLGTTSIFVDHFGKLYIQLVNLEKRAIKPEHKDEAKNLYSQLIGKGVVGTNQLEVLDAAATKLGLIIGAANATQQRDSEVAAASAPMVSSFTAWPHITAPTLPDILELVGLLHRVETESGKTAEQQREDLRQLELWFNRISGLIVVFTGLSVLYLGKASFGSLADYLGLLLWGTAVDEGFKLARQFAPGLVGQVAPR
ncbi:MAG: hypothetical protein JXB07_07175 [Anaerolineae bacterium]|nr:hypothetical protein [Anaerolineae bacterium]